MESYSLTCSRSFWQTMGNNNMKTLHVFFICRFIDKLLKLEQAEREVHEVKQEAINKVNEVNKTLKKAGQLQKIVMQKTTTTYYIAKAAGVLR